MCKYCDEPSKILIFYPEDIKVIANEITTYGKIAMKKLEDKYYGHWKEMIMQDKLTSDRITHINFEPKNN